VGTNPAAHHVPDRRGGDYRLDPQYSVSLLLFPYLCAYRFDYSAAAHSGYRDNHQRGRPVDLDLWIYHSALRDCQDIVDGDDRLSAQQTERHERRPALQMDDRTDGGGLRYHRPGQPLNCGTALYGLLPVDVHRKREAE